MALSKPNAVKTPRTRLTPDAITQMFERFRAHEPAPKTELVYTDAYTLLVAVVMSAQSTDAGVNKATAVLFQKASTPQKMLALGADKIADIIRTVNFRNTKARNMVALSKALIETYGSVVPRSLEALQTLPGVGRKTANVILNTIFGEPTLAVDTHVFRVANRTGLAPGEDVVAVETSLMKRIPKAFLVNAHHWLILHGRYTCKARMPHCPTCLIRDICLYPDKTPIASAAQKRTKK